MANDKWEPCPRCGSNRVVKLGAMHYWWEMIKLWFCGIFVGVLIALFYPPAGLVIAGLSFIGGALVEIAGIIKPDLRCQDCKNIWNYDQHMKESKAGAD